METTIQISLAAKAGMVDRPGYENRSWLQEYEYHLGMVKNPLPFGLFRLKFDKLNRMFEQDPDGKNSSFDKPILALCNELGY